AGRSICRTGVWVGESKIASLGIHVGRWVTRHGFALNVNMDLSPFERIDPCGIHGAQVTSMAQELSRPVSIREVTAILTEQFGAEFGVSLLPASLPELFDATSRRIDMSDRDEPAIVGGAQ
ncbi:MAG TPA: lipoyl(octanoyl) transferase LipB, partial [Patescibacteria group bacterium]|nr:lipoyl(octanoyl) transferase LipB [Patescibacteria group bacterium]